MTQNYREAADQPAGSGIRAGSSPTPALPSGPGPSPHHAVGRADVGVFDRDRPYRLHPTVALRPERFGALAYSYSSRRLSLLKDVDLVTVVQGLAEHPSAAAALAEVPGRKRAAVEKALARLVETGFVCERHPSPTA